MMKLENNLHRYVPQGSQRATGTFSLDILSENLNVNKHGCSKVTNARISVASANPPDQKPAVREVAEQYTRKLLNSGKIRIGCSRFPGKVLSPLLRNTVWMKS